MCVLWSLHHSSIHLVGIFEIRFQGRRFDQS